MAGRIVRFLAETGMRQEEVCGLGMAECVLGRRWPVQKSLWLSVAANRLTTVIS